MMTDQPPATLDTLASVLLRLPARDMRRLIGDMGQLGFDNEGLADGLIDWAEQHSHRPIADERHFKSEAER